MSDDLAKNSDALISQIRGIIEQRKNPIPELASSSRYNENAAISFIHKSPEIAYQALFALITNKLPTETQETGTGFTTTSVQQADIRQWKEDYNELQGKYEQLRIELEQLQRELEPVYPRSQSSWGMGSGSEKQRLKDQVAQLQREKVQLEHKIDDLSQSMAKQNEAYAEINERLNSALRELSAYRRDPTTHVRADDLYTKYQSFKQQQFNATARNILQFSEQKEDGKAMEQILEIKAYLSGITIMAAYDLFHQEALLERLQDLKEELCKMALPQVLANDLVEKINHHLSDLSASLEDSADHRREQKIQASVQSIQQKWGLPESMGKALQVFCEEVFTLIHEMCPPNVPTTLWVPEPQSQFEQEKHKEVTGYLDSGYILETIFPGYQIGNQIVDRAEVTTTPSIEE